MKWASDVFIFFMHTRVSHSHLFTLGGGTRKISAPINHRNSKRLSLYSEFYRLSDKTSNCVALIVSSKHEMWHFNHEISTLFVANPKPLPRCMKSSGFHALGSNGAILQTRMCFSELTNATSARFSHFHGATMLFCINTVAAFKLLHNYNLNAMCCLDHSESKLTITMNQKLKLDSRASILLLHIGHRCQQSSACFFSVMRDDSASEQRCKIYQQVFALTAEMMNGYGWGINNKTSITEPDCFINSIPVRWLTDLSLFHLNLWGPGTTCIHADSAGITPLILKRRREGGEACHKCRWGFVAQLLRNSCSLER